MFFVGIGCRLAAPPTAGNRGSWAARRGSDRLLKTTSETMMTAKTARAARGRAFMRLAGALPCLGCKLASACAQRGARSLTTHYHHRPPAGSESSRSQPPPKLLRSADPTAPLLQFLDLHIAEPDLR